MWNPLDRWGQQGSFLEPASIPSAEPGDAPLMCISLNEQWVPLLCGAAMQLMQPTTWDAASDAALQAVLGSATDLIATLGALVPCTSGAPCLLFGYQVVPSGAVSDGTNFWLVDWNNAYVLILNASGAQVMLPIQFIQFTGVYSNLPCIAYSPANNEILLNDGNRFGIRWNHDTSSYAAPFEFVSSEPFVVAFVNAQWWIGFRTGADVITAFDDSGAFQFTVPVTPLPYPDAMLDTGSVVWLLAVGFAWLVDYTGTFTGTKYPLAVGTTISACIVGSQIWVLSTGRVDRYDIATGAHLGLFTVPSGGGLLGFIATMGSEVWLNTNNEASYISGDPRGTIYRYPQSPPPSGTLPPPSGTIDLFPLTQYP